MKKYLLILLLFISTIGFSQPSRNTILGIYTGTQNDYSSDSLIGSVVVTITEYPLDTARVIITDTTNDIIDTLIMHLVFNFNGVPIDTSMWDGFQFCGDYVPISDSIFYAYFHPDSNPTFPEYTYYLKCAQHTLPTLIQSFSTISVKLYPNPANNKLIVQYDKNQLTYYAVVNSTGQILLDGVIDNPAKTEIDISALPSGMYCIKLKGDKGEAVKTFVKE